MGQAKVRGTITYGWDGERPDAMGPDMQPWTVTLRYRGRTMTTPFFTGSMAGEPTIAGVLECLTMDASVEGSSFPEWASDFGYDTDSRKAEALWRAVTAQTKKLRQFLGDEFDAIAAMDDRELARICADAD